MDNILKYSSFINENKEIKEITILTNISFKYNGKELIFSGKNSRDVYTNIMEWFYEINYFEDYPSKRFKDRLYTKDEIDELVKQKTYLSSRGIEKLKNADYWYVVWFSTNQCVDLIKQRLNNISGVDKNSINFEIDSKSIKQTDDIERLPNRNIDIEETTSKVDTPSDVKKDLVKPETAVKNPFMQAVCVIGGSGAGKSYTVAKILENNNHDFRFIIPTATTTNLLSQYNPNNGKYVRSRLGEMIMEAINNPSKYYTAVFDEFHKSNTIEMINDELLQCISTKRNAGNRFISLDKSTIKLYRIDEEDNSKLYEIDDIPFKLFHGSYNLVLPDNLGFIFISSKEKVVINNTDFFNRVDIIILTKDDWGMKSTQDLLSKKLNDEEKNEMKSNYDE